MRTIVAGSREVFDYQTVVHAIEDAHTLAGLVVTTVVSGAARGVDQLGERYAREHALPCDRRPANWAAHGKRAGYLRNVEMAQSADALVAVWNGKSRGTKHMIDIATAAGLLVYVHRV